MTSRQLAQVGLGLIGVLALLEALTIFSSVVSAGNAGPRGSDILVVAVPLALLLGLSYVLVFRSGQIASAIASDSHAAAEPGAPDLSRVLVVLVGVWMFAQAAPIVVNEVLAFYAAGEYPDPTGHAGIVRSFVGSAIRLAIALFLIMRPGRLLAYVRRQLPERAA